MRSESSLCALACSSLLFLLICWASLCIVFIVKPIDVVCIAKISVQSFLNWFLLWITSLHFLNLLRGFNYWRFLVESGIVMDCEDSLWLFKLLPIRLLLVLSLDPVLDWPPMEPVEQPLRLIFSDLLLWLKFWDTFLEAREEECKPVLREPRPSLLLVV